MTVRLLKVARRPRPSNCRRHGLLTQSAAVCKECPELPVPPWLGALFRFSGTAGQQDPMPLSYGRTIAGQFGPTPRGTRFASSTAGALQLVVGARLIILVSATKR